MIKEKPLNVKRVDMNQITGTYGYEKHWLN